MQSVWKFEPREAYRMGWMGPEKSTNLAVVPLGLDSWLPASNLRQMLDMGATMAGKAASVA